MAGLYDNCIKNKTAEEILQAPGIDYSATAPYLQVAAQVRSNQELIVELKKASDDSGKMARRVVWLTFALVAVGMLQAAATWFHR